MINRQGLSRNIPSEIKAEIRRRSKYGCVKCRRGIYQFEHIDPSFADASSHDPDSICCLCGSCHEKVSRGLLSKASVRDAYRAIQQAPAAERPWDFFDFDGVSADLAIGGLVCRPTPDCVFRCDGVDVFRVVPMTSERPTAINAIFCDAEGQETLRIEGNEWLGPTHKHDLEITGQKFMIRARDGSSCLILRHIPPGVVAIERLDMRIGAGHLLASQHDLAIGKYNGFDDNLIWLHAKMRIDRALSGAVAIEIGPSRATPQEIAARISCTRPGVLLNLEGVPGAALATDPGLANRFGLDRHGLFWPDLGFQVGRGCELALSAAACGVASLAHARKHFFRRNRMNATHLYLPGRLTPENIAAAKERDEDFRARHGTASMPPEPFLVQSDRKALSRWAQRNQRSGEPPRDALFRDDKPGLYAGWGVIKLVDAYAGPAIRVTRRSR